MDLEISEESDVAYLQLGPREVRSVQQVPVELQNGTLIIDLDDRGQVIGFEFLGALKLIPESERQDVPSPDAARQPGERE